MNDNKFLTVFAVFDEQTQRKLCELQSKIIKEIGSNGVQTMDIPFHITLASFPTCKEGDLVAKIDSICTSHSSFAINLDKIGFFDSRVVFAEPTVNDDLIELHKHFDCNYANGFDWHAHATLYIDDCENNVERAKSIALEQFKPIKGHIVGIQMGEFFPTRIITAYNLLNNKTKIEQK